MEVLLFFMLCAVLISLIALNGKVKRLELLLRSGTERTVSPEKKPVKTEETVSPAQSAQTPPKQKKENKPNTFHHFWTWFWKGNLRGKENVSVEYAVATTWLMRAGVLILLCGIGFFLKYSIENNLINPSIRICLTFLVGLTMFLGGFFMVNKRFHIFGVGVLAAGIITLYMGAVAGYKLYHLFPAGIAFTFMVLTTTAGMLVSVRLNLLPTALTACTGAYATPVLLSDGSGNLPFFMGYIAVLSAGILIASRERRWRSLEITSIVLSFLLMLAGISALTSKLTWLCFVFLFLNYLVYSSIPLIRKKCFPTGNTEWLLPIFSTVAALGEGLVIIDRLVDLPRLENIAMAGYSILLSGICLGEGLYLNRKQKIGSTILPSYLCASMFALVIAVPLALENRGAVSTAWSVLGMVLVLAAERSKLKTLLVLSMLVFAAALLNVCYSYSILYYPVTFSDRLFNGGMFTVCLLCAAWFLRNHTASCRITGKDTFFSLYKVFYCATGGLSFFFYTSHEVYHNLKMSDSLSYFRHGGLSVWWGILVVALIVYGIRRNIKELRITALILFLICLVKVYCVDISGLNTLGKVIAFLILGILFLGAAMSYILFRKSFSKEDV